MKEIYSAFAKAQSQFNKAVKDSTNPHFKSKYANLESVIDAISKALQDNGLAFMQPLSSVENKWFIHTQLVHSSGESIESPKVELIIQDKSNPQKFGSSLTYFRRYSLMAFFGIPDTDDDGNEASNKDKDESKPKTPSNHAPQTDEDAKALKQVITKEERSLLKKEILRLNLTELEFMNIVGQLYGIRDIHELDLMKRLQYNQVMDYFTKSKNKESLEILMSKVL